MDGACGGGRKNAYRQATDPVAGQIERYLLERRDWVSAAELCERFGISERRLRQMYDRPGLCTAFAISLSKQGFKHVAMATEAEWIHAKNAARRGRPAKCLRRCRFIISLIGIPPFQAML